MSEFVHLHLHSEYSLLDGACRIEELLDRAVELKMPALAITEHGNMFSSIIFHDQARKRGINPILGCEVYVAPGDRRTKSGTPGETANHLVLLAETRQGYHNLIKLVSSGYTEGFYYKPRIDKDLLAAHSAGLIGLSSCLKGEVATGIRTEQMAKAMQAAATYRDILGPGNFFLEMQYQGIDEQRVVNVGLAPIARDLNLPLVCTNDVHYLKNSDHRPHDVLLCIGTGKTVTDTDRLRYHGDQFYLKTAQEMAAVFGDFPEAMANTVRIAERCHVDLSETVNYLPNFDVPPGFTLDAYFEQIVREGFEYRLPRLKDLQARGILRHTIEEYERRLSYEVEMIKQMKYPGTSSSSGTSSATRASSRFRSARAEARRPAASSPTACASPTSIRSSTTSSSNASSTPSVCRCPTSISTSASAAAARSSTTSRASTGARTSRRSSPSGR